MTFGVTLASTDPAETKSSKVWPEWIESMKQARMGPFESIRWFCKDGTVLLPKPYACAPHGGGRQHGQRGKPAETLRAAGIPLANVLAEVKPEQALANNAALLKALLVEQHLVKIDGGWIFQQAQYVRGVFQIENDIAAASEILSSMAANPSYTQQDLLLFREAVRRLPDSGAGTSLDKIRTAAGILGGRDAGFARLRNKIHSYPEASDADAVQKYAAVAKDQTLKSELLKLASDITALYQAQPLGDDLAVFAKQSGVKKFEELARQWRINEAAEHRLEVAVNTMTLTRSELRSFKPAMRVAAMRLSLKAEDSSFVAAREVAEKLEGASPAQRLNTLALLLRAMHGSALLTDRELAALNKNIAQLTAAEQVPLGQYRLALVSLARAPVWAANRLGFYFNETLKLFNRVEAKTVLLIPDRLRAGPALSFGNILESLTAEADQLAGIRHEMFGKAVTSGLRALNPGLARGPLQPLADLVAGSDHPAVVLAPESAADLPSVAGILTAAEGNALSHVQLLARNLGVPNVVVGSELLEAMNPQLGKEVVLAASPQGVVRLALDGPQWATLFPKQQQAAVSIKVDVERLDLSVRTPLAMAALRTDDSGRTVGPKAAKLGELSARYPAHVSTGLAIPFGAFREALETPRANNELSMLDWMRSSYQQLREIPDASARQKATAAFLSEVRNWFGNYRFPDAFRSQLTQDLNSVFGKEGSFGVFVRSDTNVEDLPGFTGAGLNLTVPNVVGIDNILKAIRQVWASPFTERAYGWRQALMDQPEQLYVAVLLHKTVPGDKSGVMITADLSSNDPGWMTVATNEGVGGGVEGQAAESLRVNIETGEVDLLASATEPRRRVVLAKGGSELVPAKAPEILLQAEEIQALAEVARNLPQKYPTLRDAAGIPAPADVEFAFVGGKLYLNQIRPFLQSDRARSNAFLLSLDAGLEASAKQMIDLGVHP